MNEQTTNEPQDQPEEVRGADFNATLECPSPAGADPYDDAPPLTCDPVRFAAMAELLDNRYPELGRETARQLAGLVMATLEPDPYISALGRAALRGVAEIMEELRYGRRSVDDESPAQVVARFEAIARAEAALTARGLGGRRPGARRTARAGRAGSRRLRC